MNYVFAHFGKAPSHLSDFFNTILSVDSEAEIFFINDYGYENKYVKSYQLNKFKDLENKSYEIKKLVYSTGVDNNPLWASSLIRIFAVQTIAKFLEIDEFVHFDTDVLIYKSFKQLEESGIFVNHKINITYHDKDSLIFGYSYFPKIELLDELISELNNILKNYKYFQLRFTSDGNGFVSEMKMLSVISKNNSSLFNYLNSLPYWEDKYLFDPAGYGQYLDGSHAKRGNYFFVRRWIGLNTQVGKELKSKRIKVKFIKKQPIVIFDNRTTELASLHVHSKRLKKFLPKEHKKLI